MSDLLILLGTYNGERFLQSQLASYCTQTRRDWRIIISDDGSTDRTRHLLTEFAEQKESGIVKIIEGPKRGAAANFLSLIKSAPDALYTCFSDQDDVWLPSKLSRAAQLMDRIGHHSPVLYCSRVTICDQSLRPLRQSPLPTRPLSFRNAIIHNVAYGHTIVANKPATQLLQTAAARTDNIVMHDWWAYMLISGAGGKVLFDDQSHVLYRQHDSNTVGSNGLLSEFTRRLQRLSIQQNAHWMTTNLTSMTIVYDLLTSENQRLLDRLINAHAGGRIAYSNACLSEGLYRQGFLGRSAPVIAALLGTL